MRQPVPSQPLLPARTSARAELAAATDEPTLDLVDALPPDEPGEVDLARLPAWMRGVSGPGPPGEA